MCAVAPEALDGGWRVAESLDQLLAEINASAPNRSKASDGSIGDEDHQNTNSDHNPWCQGWVVTARDFTHDPKNGFDSYVYAEWQRQRCRGDILIKGKREIRVKYIISNRKIASPTQNWAWRTYTGSNAHDKHVHVSVDCTVEGGYMDDVTPWGWGDDMDTNDVWNVRPQQINSGLDRPAGQSLQDVWIAVHGRLQEMEATLNQVLAILQSGIPVATEVNLSNASIIEIRDAVADLGEGGAAQVRADE